MREKKKKDGLKSKYCEEIKAGSKLSPDQKKAVDFFNRYNEESEQNKKVAEQQKSVFLKKLVKFLTTSSKVLNIKLVIKDIDLMLKTLAK